MADAKIGRAVLELTIDDKQYKLALAGAGTEADKTAARIKRIGTVLDLAFFREMGRIGVAAIRSVGETLGELIERGSQVQTIEGSFESLTSAIGLTKAEMLDTARSATKGLISDFDLMQAGNKALLLGLPVTSKSFGSMAQAATTLGRAMGQDAKKSFDDLITALGRGSPLILDNLGITVRVSDANEAYARQLGKSASALTEAEKKTAFYNAAMIAAEEKTKQLGGIHLTLAEHVQTAKVNFQNFVDQLGKAIVSTPALKTLVEFLSNKLKDLAGMVERNRGAIQDWITRGLLITIDAFDAILSAAPSVLNFFEALTRVWEGLKAIDLEAQISSVRAELKMLAEGQKAMADAGAEVVPELQENGRVVQDLTRKLHELELQHAAVGKASQDSEQRFDSYHAAVGRIRASVAELRNELAKAGQDLTGDKNPIKKLGDTSNEVAQRAPEQTKKIADAFRKLNEDIVLSTKLGMDRRLAELNMAQAEEIRKLQELTGITKAEKDKGVLLIEEKYRGMIAAARLGSDEIRTLTQTLENDLALLQTTGTTRTLMELEFRKQKELEAIANLKLNYTDTYNQLVIMISEKYRVMTEQAQGHFGSVQLAAAAAGFKTRAELEEQAIKAKHVYDQMLASGQFTYQQLQKAHQAYKEAEDAANEKSRLSTQQQLEILASSASTILRSLFGKNKAAAMAAVVIDTAAAIVKTLKEYPFPFNLVPAAAVAAAGAAQLAVIKRQQATGFEFGTPGLDFAGFGSASLTVLHGQEAVIPRGGGHLLAGEIAAAMPQGGDGEMLDRLDRMNASLDALPRTMKRAFRDALLLAN